MTPEPGEAGGDKPEAALRRVLGLSEVTAGGVGIIVGAGIYVLIGAATAQAGAAVWLAFALAAGLSGLTALSYMELTSMFPSAAGEYEYTRHVMPPRISFLVGWLMVTGLIIAAATVSLGFASYLSYFLELDVRVAAAMLLVVVCLVALTGIRESALLTMALSVLQVGGLVLIILIGVPHIGEQNLLTSHGPGAVLGAAALIFFAFIGFDEVITLAEEAKDPRRTIPIALALALGLSTLLYIGVAIAAVSVLGADIVAGSQRPLADVFGHEFGDSGASLMAIFALVSTANTTLLAVTASSRILFGIARRGALPSVLARLDKRRRTPTAAIVATTAIAWAFAMLKDLTLIASTTDFAVYIVFLAVNGTVVILRWKEPWRERPFNTPLSVGPTPVLPLLAFVSVVIMITQLEMQAILLGCVLILAGLAATQIFRSTDGT